MHSPRAPTDKRGAAHPNCPPPPPSSSRRAPAAAVAAPPAAAPHTPGHAAETAAPGRLRHCVCWCRHWNRGRGNCPHAARRPGGTTPHCPALPPQHSGPHAASGGSTYTHTYESVCSIGDKYLLLDLRMVAGRGIVPLNVPPWRVIFACFRRHCECVNSCNTVNLWLQCVGVQSAAGFVKFVDLRTCLMVVRTPDSYCRTRVRASGCKH